MKDKLTFKKKQKRKRTDWIKVIAYLGLQDYFLLEDDYKKIKSLNRRCFNWFLSKFGRKYVNFINSNQSNFYLDDHLLADVLHFKRSHPSVEDIDEIRRIAHIKWIKYPEEV